MSKQLERANKLLEIVRKHLSDLVSFASENREMEHLAAHIATFESLQHELSLSQKVADQDFVNKFILYVHPEQIKAAMDWLETENPEQLKKIKSVI